MQLTTVKGNDDLISILDGGYKLGSLRQLATGQDCILDDYVLCESSPTLVERLD
jgi:hypothetical protein